MAMLAFAGVDDAPSPMLPGGIRYATFVPPSYKSDYLPSMDYQSAPVFPPLQGWFDDLFGDAGTAATDSVTQSIVAQVPTIVAAVVASPAYQAQMTKIKTEAALGGAVLGALIVGGVYLVMKK